VSTLGLGFDESALALLMTITLQSAWCHACTHAVIRAQCSKKESGHARLSGGICCTHHAEYCRKQQEGSVEERVPIASSSSGAIKAIRPCPFEAVFVKCCVVTRTNQSFVQSAMRAFIPRADIYRERILM